MKVFMPVMDSDGAKGHLASGFEVDHACIYDSETQSFEWIQTKDLSVKVGNLSLQLKRKNIKTVICNNMPVSALGLFTELGLRVYRAKSKLIEENVKLLESQELSPLTFSQAMAMEHCASACSTCGTGCN